MELKTQNLKQGEIKSLFPNLGMEVICNGCICVVIGITPFELQMRVIEPFKSTYKIGATFWNTSFLIN